MLRTPFFRLICEWCLARLPSDRCMGRFPAVIQRSRHRYWYFTRPYFVLQHCLDRCRRVDGAVLRDPVATRSVVWHATLVSILDHTLE